MTSVYANSKKNYIYLKLIGCADKREIETLLNNTIQELEKLSPGFALIIKFSEFSTQTKSDEILFHLLLQSIKEHGVIKTIFIGNILENLKTNNNKKTIWHSVCMHFEKASSFNDAMKLLDEYQMV